jgi:cell division protein FtsQ
MRAGERIRRRQPAAPGVSVPTDRRYRRPDLRFDARRRAGRAIVRSARWVLPLILLVAGTAWTVARLADSSLMSVRHIEVSGHHRLSTGEVEALVDGLRGQNIFRIDFDEYRRRVMDSPWVESVNLWRVLPSTIEVRIVERVPMAVARLGRQLFLVDGTGVIIDEYGPQYRDIDLPIVDGLMTSTASGADASRERVHLASSLLDALSARPDLRRRLSQVDVSNSRDAVVMFDGDLVKLHLGDERFLERLHMYLELAPTFGERFAGVDYVDLRFDERVFVRAAARADRAVERAGNGQAR